MSEVEAAIPVAQTPEPTALRLVATLAVAGLVSGFVLAGVFQITKPIIDRNNAEALKRGVYKVVPGSTVMQRVAVRDGKLVALPEAEETTEPVIYAAYDPDDGFVGYAIENNGPGFQDDIRLLYGYDPAASLIVGMEILASRETPGLGDKIFKDADFVANFGDLAVDPEIVVVKGGRNAPNEVDAITGATISSKAVVKIINAANGQWLPALPDPGSEPPLVAAPKAPAGAGEEG